MFHWGYLYVVCYKAEIPIVHNANVNVTKKIKNIELVRECFRVPKCECKLQRWQNESLPVVIGQNANVLSDGKSPHTQNRHRVAHAAQRENYTGALITFIICIRCSHLDYTQVE